MVLRSVFVLKASPPLRTWLYSEAVFSVQSCVRPRAVNPPCSPVFVLEDSSLVQTCVRPRGSTFPYRVRHCIVYSILCCPANQTTIEGVRNDAPVVIDLGGAVEDLLAGAHDPVGHA